MENLQLAQTELDEELSDQDDEQQQQTSAISIKQETSQHISIVNHRMLSTHSSNEINQQLLVDIDVKPYNDEELEIDSDENLVI